MAGKAKLHYILTPYERKALFDLGRKKLNERELSAEQSDFLDMLLLSALVKGIAEVSCLKPQCTTCDEINILDRSVRRGGRAEALG